MFALFNQRERTRRAFFALGDEEKGWMEGVMEGGGRTGVGYPIRVLQHHF